MNSAKKDKTGKIDLTILPLEGLIHAAKAGLFGAEKYGRYNYHKGHLNTDLLAAALRHIFKYNEGQDLDDESGVHHLGHAIFDLMMILDELHRGSLEDNRAAPRQVSTYTQTLDGGGAYMIFNSSPRGSL